MYRSIEAEWCAACGPGKESGVVDRNLRRTVGEVEGKAFLVAFDKDSVCGADDVGRGAGVGEDSGIGDVVGVGGCKVGGGCGNYCAVSCGLEVPWGIVGRRPAQGQGGAGV